MKNIPITSITYSSSDTLYSIDFYDISELQKFFKKFKFTYDTERPVRVNLKEICMKVYQDKRIFMFFYIYSDYIDSSAINYQKNLD